ncbi:MAG: prolyl oligopeptidase family serine peptidase, partial [bacterium]|nr:prolyl oligopeptidase family serine peptidase [bacterium]
MNEKRAVGYDYKVCSAGLVLILTVLCTASWALDPLPVPPQASVVPHEYWKHGQIIQDNYFWLRQKDNPTVLEYIKAENRYAEDMMKHTGQFQENLFQEMRSRIKETDLSVPEKLDDYYYYSRMEKGKEYAIHCRKKDSLQSEEEILLDENELAAGHDFFSLGVYEVSPNHELLMYSVETSGSEEYTIHFKNLKNPSLVYEETIVNTDTTAEWANDSKIIFYITLDDSHRPYQLHRHTLGTTTELDTMLYEEEAEAYSTFISKTRSKQYLVLAIESNTTSELHILNANTPEKEFKPVHTRKKGVECSIAHHGDRLFILTNDKAVNFRLMEAPVSDFSRYLWKEIIAHRPSVAIEGIDVFSGHLVIYERSDGLRKMRVRNLTNNQEYYIEFPEPVYTFWEGSNYDFNTNVLRFTYSSLITPETVYDYDLDTRERELKKKQEVPEYDPQKYLTEKIFATTDDGTRVPISLVYRKDLTLNGQNPCFMEGYGAYGDSLEPYFFTTCLSLLDRGFVYAIAHVRGGSEMGRLWYKQGKLLRKRNTFTDFIACAKYLIK